MIREAIIKEMKLMKHSRAYLARSVGCSTPTVTNFLNNKKGIDFSILEKILEKYDLEIVKRYK